ncbi:MAG: RtcB family protein [Phycisphaerales bacterium]
MRVAVKCCAAAAQAGLGREAIRTAIEGLIENPTGYADDAIFSPLVNELMGHENLAKAILRQGEPAPHRIWGEGLEAGAVQQLRTACDLAVSAAAALMPDAHVGYGLPIGGVLATRGAVIPYAVGVDIACRMKLTVVDLPVKTLDNPAQREALIRAIEEETRFGVGAEFRKPRGDEVLEADWGISPITLRNRRKAEGQLGTSGSGNHFVEWGVLTVPEGNTAGFKTRDASGFGSGWNFDLAPGEYLALLSHSGSRGPGAAVCDHYSKLAMERHPNLPKEMRHLAWLDLESPEGIEYWQAMNLMGRFASANHACIHDSIVRHLGTRSIAFVENHHNFAWKEMHDLGNGPEELVVHRKGATPAGKGVLGVIPGSMASPGFVVCGKGSEPSLRSASHGAGRVMSRTKAREAFVWGNVRRQLDDLGVQVLSAGIDEVPGVYKDIHSVMAQQADLVAPLARFDPKIVKMAPEGERAED